VSSFISVGFIVCWCGFRSSSFELHISSMVVVAALVR
jgi:hypothetical protein